MSKLFKILVIGIFLFRVDVCFSEELVAVENPKIEEKIEEKIESPKLDDNTEIKIETEIVIKANTENKLPIEMEEMKENGPKRYILENYNVVEGTKQKGQATYYAKKFHGKKTNNGEKFSIYEFTGAHRTLPFGTLVKVTNRDNGKSVVVRINDRGPFSKGKIIDLSPAAFEELASLKKGVLNVSVEVLEEIKNKSESDVEAENK